MKIGIISTEYLPATGGAQTYLENLIKVLEKNGHQCGVYQFDNGVSSAKVHLIRHKPRIFPGGRALDLWWFNFALLSKWKELSREDMLIVNYAFHSWPLFWHRKVIVLSHGCEWDIPPTSLSQRLKINIAKWSYKYFKFLVANDTNYFRQMGVKIRPKEKMYEEVLSGKWFLPNAVDTNIFRKSKPDPKIDKLNAILIPRNISHARGIHLAIQAYAIFRKKYPQTNLVVVGDFFDESYKEYIFKLIKDLSLEGKVHFMGNIQWSKMPGVYSSGQMTIIPTLQREGTSLAGLESMSCGTATVTTDRWGLADLPSEQSSADSESLAEVLIRVFSSRKEIGLKQRNLVQEKYNLELWGKAWIKVIEEVGNENLD